MIHTVKGFGIVNKAEIGIFLELSCFFDDPADARNYQFGFFLVIDLGLSLYSVYRFNILLPQMIHRKHTTMWIHLA